MEHTHPTDSKAVRAIVSGRVQRVMYRDFAQRKARSLGIVGTVRNLPDETVEVVAQGSAEVLALYLKKLQKGSILAHVESVNVDWIAVSDRYADFVILY